MRPAGGSAAGSSPSRTSSRRGWSRRWGASSSTPRTTTCWPWSRSSAWSWWIPGTLAARCGSARRTSSTASTTPRRRRSRRSGRSPGGSGRTPDARAACDRYASSPRPAPSIGSRSRSISTTIGATGWIRKLIAVAYVGEYGLECDQLSSINLLAIDLDRPGRRPPQLSTTATSATWSGGAPGGSSTPSPDGWGDGPILLEHRLESVRAAGRRRSVSTSPAGRPGRSASRPTSWCSRSPSRSSGGSTSGSSCPRRRSGRSPSWATARTPRSRLGFRRRVWRDLGYAGAIFTDAPFGTAWDHSRFQAGEAGGLTLLPRRPARASPSTEGTDADQAERLLRRVERSYPDAASAYNGRAARSSWPTAPLALGSYASYKIGQWTTIAGTEAAPVGNLFFAGEHCHVFGDSGFMNSGVVSGRATARALLARLDGH